MSLCYFPTKSIQLETISTTFSQFNQSFTKWAYTRKMSNKFFSKTYLQYDKCCIQELSTCFPASSKLFQVVIVWYESV